MNLISIIIGSYPRSFIIIHFLFNPWGVGLRPLGRISRTCLPLYPPSIVTVVACMLPYEHVSWLMSI